MGAVMRADLSADLTDNLNRLAELAATSGADTVVAVIVDEEGVSCPMCCADHRRLCDALTAALDDHGVGLYGAHVVDRVEAGGRWHCVDDCGASGAVEDPTASPLAAAAVLDGRRLYARRSDLHAVIAEIDASRSARLVEPILAQAAARSAQWGADPDGCGRRDVETAIEVAARVSDGVEPADDELTELACGLTDVAVRDTLYALAVGEQAAAAEALWALLAPLLQRVGGAATWGDAFMLVGSLAAQLLMVLQKVEAWPVWIIVNVVGTVLYASQGLYFTSMFYTALILMAITGWRTWSARTARATPVADYA